MAETVTNFIVNGVTAGTGFSSRRRVEVATTAPGVLASSYAAGATIDGYVLVLSDRLLIKNQITASENGVYDVTAGTPTRSMDLQSGSSIAATYYYIINGTINGATIWACTNAAGSDIVGTNSLTFSKVSGNVHNPSLTSTSTALVRWLDTGGYNVQNSTVLLDGSGNLTALGTLTPSGGTASTLPPVGGTLVTLAGVETLSNKTFSTSVAITAATNQLILGPGPTMTLNFPTPLASRVWNFPITNGLTGQALTTNGGAPATISWAYPTASASGADGSIQFATSGLLNSNPTRLFWDNSTFKLGVNTNVPSVELEVVGTTKLNSGSNQLVIGNTANLVTINAATPAAARVYTIQDTGTSTANFIMSELAQTINGAKTFTSAVAITAASNQLALGTGAPTTTISAPATGTARTYTAPDTGTATADFVMTEASQTINGFKKFSSIVALLPTTNQLVLGTVNTTTLSFVAPASSIAWSFPNANGTSGMALTTNGATPTATLSWAYPTAAASGADGSIQFATSGLLNSNPTRLFWNNSTFRLGIGTNSPNEQVEISGGSLRVNTASNQIKLGTTNTINISATAVAANRLYVIPEVSTDSTFIMADGLQIFNGKKLVNSTTTFGFIGLSAYTVLYLDVSSEVTGSVLTNGQLLIGRTGNTPIAATLTQGTGITITNGSGTITVTNSGVTSFSAGTTGFTPSTATTGAITLAGTLIAANGGTGFSSYTVGDILYASTTTALSRLADVATGNALISGGVSTAPSWGKISLTTAVSGILPIANGGTNSSAALTNGKIMVSVAGAIVEGTSSSTPTFSSATLSATSNQLTLGTTNTILINAPSPASSVTYIIPDVAAAAYFVLDKAEALAIENASASTYVLTGNSPGSASWAPPVSSVNFTHSYSVDVQNIGTDDVWQTIAIKHDANINGWTRSDNETFDCPATGVYRIEVTLLTAVTANAPQAMAGRICLNGAEIVGGFSSGVCQTDYTKYQVYPIIMQVIVNLSASDQITVQMKGTSTDCCIHPPEIFTADTTMPDAVITIVAM